MITDLVLARFLLRIAVDLSMQIHSFQSRLQLLSGRLKAVEQSLSRPTNVITFLLVRFVLMSGLVLGLSWQIFDSKP